MAWDRVGMRGEYDINIYIYILLYIIYIIHIGQVFLHTYIIIYMYMYMCMCIIKMCVAYACIVAYVRVYLLRQSYAILNVIFK